MKKNKNDKQQFEQSLLEIQQTGIQADTRNIKKDMCAQFTDPNEWIREYVVNSYDAQAKLCRVWSRSADGECTICVSDDGHGMDKQGIIDFFTLYRSRKKGILWEKVGQFGIGKLSVAAIPGQKKFKVTTSNGKECWIAEAGNLLSDDPIRIYSISKVPPKGTLFEITFETTETPDKVMHKLARILRNYTSYLPFTTELHFPRDPESDLQETIERIGQDWSADSENFGRNYNIRLFGNQYEVIMGIGLYANEIYQNKVLISERYNLLSHGWTNTIQLPHLRIRVNSSAFELPFGRHCLRNENILGPLATHIREQLLPDYFNFLFNLYDNSGEKYQSLGKTLIDIAAALVIQIPDHRKKWCDVPIFRIYPDKRVSLIRLENLVTGTGKVYLEESENAGVDYAYFDAPILLQDQPQGSITFLKEYFKSELINLSLNDVVIEMPSNSTVKLSKEELAFQANLVLSIDVNKSKQKLSPSNKMPGNGESDGFGFGGSLRRKSPYVNTETREAANAFKNLSWKVNYLVGRDGKTPCLTHRFIVNGNIVILNLYHPEIKELIKLSATAPMLAGHWAVALCLTENNRILSFLSAESREDLLFVDAIMKVNAGTECKTPLKKKEFKKLEDPIRDLLRDSGFDFDLN